MFDFVDTVGDGDCSFILLLGDFNTVVNRFKLIKIHIEKIRKGPIIIKSFESYLGIISLPLHFDYFKIIFTNFDLLANFNHFS